MIVIPINTSEPVDPDPVAPTATLNDLRAAFREEVGDLAPLAVNAEIDRWLNEGRTRMGLLDHKKATVTWSAGATEATLPSDLISLSQVREEKGSRLPDYKRWGFKMIFNGEAQSAGSATVLYRAYFPPITLESGSRLPAEANRGLLSYALYRFWKKLASNRAEFKRYATLLGQNAVTMDDLQAEADRHYNDFVESADILPAEEPVSFYGWGG